MTHDYDSDFVDRLLFGEKLCPTCDVPKPRNSEHFDRDASEDDGLTRECKACRSDRAREHYANDPEFREKRRKAYRRRAAA